MKWEDFKAEAERLGMRAAKDREGSTMWALYDRYGSEIFVYDHQHHGGTVFPKSIRCTPTEALRESARMMRGDVAGKLREWLGGCIGLAAKNDDTVVLGVMMTVLAKLDELEGKP